MDPWFDQQTAGWIGGILGTGFGITCAIIGSISGYCVKKGLKKLYFSLIGVVLATFIITAVIGLIALYIGQPYRVWYPTLLAGGLGTVIFMGILPAIHRRFTQMELKQIQAKDL